MAELQITTSFRKDYKRHQGDEDAMRLVHAIFSLLQNDLPLPASFFDHKLTGRFAHCRECHVRPNLLLIYEPRNAIVKLHRLCNHSELFNAN
ncbi:MAG: type II toxin-antitoxin system YafQ family toxin [Tepidisphaeraceae bacterium]|jgi:mRNA interferase YafQ